MLVDVVSGEVSMGWDAVASMMPLYSGGKLKFLGVAGSRRLPMLPDVPTLLEQGYPQYQYASSWYGIYAPAGTPDAAVSGLEQALLAAGKNPALVEKLQASGFLVSRAPARRPGSAWKRARALGAHREGGGHRLRRMMPGMEQA